MTILQAARDAIRAIETDIQTRQRRFNVALNEREALRAAIRTGTATLPQRGQLAALDYEILELDAAFNDATPTGARAGLERAKLELEELQRRRVGMVKRIEHLCAMRDAGIEAHANAAMAAVDEIMPFLRIAGRDDTDAGRAVFAIKSWARDALQEARGLPGWERQLVDMGE